jgi:hypothetical protein
LTFESGSRLTEIGKNAFENCLSLSSICIPAPVEFVPFSCFYNCVSLSVLSFEGGSKLTRINNRALDQCRSLRVITIPANLEVIQANLFASCYSLHQLIFEIPSRLRQLVLPPNDFDPLDIPDSVEVLSAGVRAPGSKSLLL